MSHTNTLYSVYSTILEPNGHRCASWGETLRCSPRGERGKGGATPATSPRSFCQWRFLFSVTRDCSRASAGGASRVKPQGDAGLSGRDGTTGETRCQASPSVDLHPPLSHRLGFSPCESRRACIRAGRVTPRLVGRELGCVFSFSRHDPSRKHPSHHVPPPGSSSPRRRRPRCRGLRVPGADHLRGCAAHGHAARPLHHHVRPGRVDPQLLLVYHPGDAQYVFSFPPRRAPGVPDRRGGGPRGWNGGGRGD